MAMRLNVLCMAREGPMIMMMMMAANLFVCTITYSTASTFVLFWANGCPQALTRFEIRVVALFCDWRSWKREKPKWMNFVMKGENNLESYDVVNAVKQHTCRQVLLHFKSSESSFLQHFNAKKIQNKEIHSKSYAMCKKF